MQIQVNTGKADLLFVKVPEDAHDFQIDHNKNIECDQLYYRAIFMNLPNIGTTRSLPPGKWKIIGLANEITEEQCEDLVESETDIWLQKMTYKCYTKNDAAYLSAKESFESLMEANEIYSVNPLQKPMYSSLFGEDKKMMSEYKERLSKWKRAEERTVKYLVLEQITETK